MEMSLKYNRLDGTRDAQSSKKNKAKEDAINV